jgi:hypothetical protein
MMKRNAITLLLGISQLYAPSGTSCTTFDPQAADTLHFSIASEDASDDEIRSTASNPGITGQYNVIVPLATVQEEFEIARKELGAAQER